MDEILVSLGQKYALNLTCILNLGQKLDDATQPESVTILIFSGRGNISSAAWLRLFWGSWPGHWRWELWGRAASTSIYIFILLIFPSGLCLFPSAKGNPPSHLQRHLKKSSSCVGLSLSWGSRGFHAINCKPSRCCELWHKQSEQPETHPSFL